MPTKDMMLLVTTGTQRTGIREVRSTKPKTETSIVTQSSELIPNTTTVAAMEAVNRGEFTYYDDGMDVLCVE